MSKETAGKSQHSGCTFSLLLEQDLGTIRTSYVFIEYAQLSEMSTNIVFFHSNRSATSSMSRAPSAARSRCPVCSSTTASPRPACATCHGTSRCSSRPRSAVTSFCPASSKATRYVQTKMYSFFFPLCEYLFSYTSFIAKAFGRKAKFRKGDLYFEVRSSEASSSGLVLSECVPM